jgi:hypothetical protein
MSSGHRLEQREAHLTRDGRIHHRALVQPASGRGSYMWECRCRPGEHDHDAIHAELAEKLEKREAVVGDLNALVGRTGRVGLLRYEVTDSNIQIHGPKRWVLYVAWVETPLADGRRVSRSFQLAYDDPSEALPASVVLERIEVEVRAGSEQYARAVRVVGEFVSP